MAKFILLLFFTFGIYYLVWIYKTTRLTNQCSSEEYRKPSNKLLLCMFIPFYQIYWLYQTGKRVDKLCESDISTLVLIFAIFFPIVPPIMIQSTMNTGFKKVSKNSKKNNTDIQSVPDAIKKYKDLLDSGAITNEEYEEAKKKLLNN